jgi:hypothetical protein
MVVEHFSLMKQFNLLLSSKNGCRRSEQRQPCGSDDDGSRSAARTTTAAAVQRRQGRRRQPTMRAATTGECSNNGHLRSRNRQSLELTPGLEVLLPW